MDTPHSLSMRSISTRAQFVILLRDSSPDTPLLQGRKERP